MRPKIKKVESTTICCGKLYIIPTPIGNLKDISQRALDILQEVQLILAENIRHTSFLLKHFNIKTQIYSLNIHNEHDKTKLIVKKLQHCINIALVSNAGTPLINDPGYELVRACHKFGIQVVPIPGACAAITALSASGLPTNRFCYEGFLPATHIARCNRLEQLVYEPRTLIFYESKHRLLATLQDITIIFGESRYIVLARELTKKWESIYGNTVKNIITWLQEDLTRSKGEIVLIVAGFQIKMENVYNIALQTLELLITNLNLSFKQAITLTAKIHAINKKKLYQLRLKKK
ncbi:MAG: 16S rRNA (cytidine(1402)-2'-O)-methyltransferase [Candidatus Dasytiphilus stammeri]